jgi:hypothetical protein
MDQLRGIGSVTTKKPSNAAIVITNRNTGAQTVKRVKKSSKTVDLVTQYHARHPDYFVYRINIYARKAA